ncbi:MAG: LysR family transcriptional regulator [Campylobacteraceae bacterium]|nr:LysR family transcriptional regulator [Campylobacteraceae bacterium]
MIKFRLKAHEFLKKIDETGSLLKAAKAAKISYKAAWDALKNINDTAGASCKKRYGRQKRQAAS